MNSQHYQMLAHLMEGLGHDDLLEAIKDMPWQVYDNKDETVMWDVDRLNADAVAGKFGDCFRTASPPRNLIHWENLSHPYIGELVDDLVLAKIIHGHPLYAFGPILALGGGVREDGAQEIVDILDGNHRLAAIVYAGLPEFICFMVPASAEAEYRVPDTWAHVIRTCRNVLIGKADGDAFEHALATWKASRDPAQVS